MIKQILDYLMNEKWIVNSKFHIDDTYVEYGHYEMFFEMNNHGRVHRKEFSFLDVKYVSLNHENKSAMIEFFDPESK